MNLRFCLVGLAGLAVATGSTQAVGVGWFKGEAYGGNTQPMHAAALLNGNFVVLSTVTRSGRTDAVLSCYRPNGSTLWVKTLWAADLFRPAGVHVGSTGDIFVAGSAGPLNAGQAYAARIAPAGNTFWAKRFRIGTGDDEIVASALDSGNNLHLTGSGRRLSGLGYDQPLYLRVNANGSRGLALFNPITPSSSSGVAIRANGAGRAAVVIQTAGGSRVWGIDSTSGTLYEKAVPVIDDVVAVEVAPGGEVYLGGRYYNTANDSAPAVQKLSSTGATLWSRWMNFAYSGDSLDGISRIRLDGSGNVYAVGSAYNHNLDFCLFKISPAGGIQFAKLNNSAAADSADIPGFLEIGPRSDVYVAGSMTNTANAGFLATRFTTLGGQTWERYLPTSGTTELEFRTAAFSAATGQLLMVHHDPAGSRLALYALRQPAIPSGDSYLMARNSTLNGSTVFANDVYALDGTAVPVQMPAHGTLNMNSNGTFTYTPQVGYTGIDNFTYKIVKGGVSDSAAVQVVISIN